MFGVVNTTVQTLIYLKKWEMKDLVLSIQLLSPCIHGVGIIYRHTDCLLCTFLLQLVTVLREARYMGLRAHPCECTLPK